VAPFLLPRLDMAEARAYKKLDAWEQAMELVED
jgi:hypothetical protein